ncbi:hypothetical protein KHA80_21005 [Anaerobacillus sp. HL2]|nr:hypothetical protein KHA80_21005 [Anaerobacillus sp. HL2]
MKLNKEIVLFSIDQLNLETKIIYNGIWINGHEERIVDSIIPPYIYNLVLHSKYTSVSKMRNLRMVQGIKVINPINRFYQNILFEMISSIHQTSEVIFALLVFFGL